MPRKRMTIVCQQCGKTVPKYKNNHTTARKKYCSVECRNEARKGEKIKPEHIQASLDSRKKNGDIATIGTIRKRNVVGSGVYYFIKLSDEQNKRQWFPYHRYLMEGVLGRSLDKEEIIHHLDGNSLNNDLDNLVLVSRKEHSIINKLLRVVDMGFAKHIVSTLIARFPSLKSEICKERLHG